jgi:hypothetical protein
MDFSPRDGFENGTKWELKNQGKSGGRSQGEPVPAAA